jgi:hypothetical protein
MKELSCHDPKMVAYCQVVRLLEEKFDGLELNHIARRSNKAADELAKLASCRAPAPASVFTSDMYMPSITYQGSAQDSSEPPTLTSGANPTLAPTDLAIRPNPLPDWRIPYLDCLVRGILPTDKTKARRLARRAKSLILLDRELYKQSPLESCNATSPVSEGKAIIGHPWGLLQSLRSATHPYQKHVLIGRLLAHCHG